MVASQVRQLPVIWVKGKDPKEKESIEYILRNNKILISEFLKILDQMEAEELRAEREVVQYDNPNWQFKQADRNGGIRILNKVKQLFNFMES